MTIKRDNNCITRGFCSGIIVCIREVLEIPNKRIGVEGRNNVDFGEKDMSVL